MTAPDTSTPDEPFQLPWTAGPHDGFDGPVVVSLTDFQYRSLEDLKECVPLGMELGRSWPIMNGAVGLWLWSKPQQLRIGSVSVWRDAADLWRFVRWPVHQNVVREFRDRGHVTAATTTWTEQRFDPERVWPEAVRRLQAHDPTAPT